MAATRCAVVVFKRVYCIPVQTSSGDRMAGKVAECFSVIERLHLSVRLKEHFASAQKRAQTQSVGVARG